MNWGIEESANEIADAYYEAAWNVASWTPLSAAQLAETWFWATEWLLFIWFQPLLLRLGLGRGLLWMCLGVLPSPTLDIIMRSGAISIPSQLEETVFVFFATSLPCLALIGYRVRWWLTIPAAACFTAITMAFADSMHAYTAASCIYAPFLLFGTRTIRN